MKHSSGFSWFIWPTLRKVKRAMFPRSMGMRVGRRVAGAIAAGDAARSRNDWSVALSHYTLAVQRDPMLAHIWVQLGHARKETSDLAGARSAYHRAALLNPEDPEPHVHLGLASKLLGEREVAASHYLTALERRPGDLALAIEVVRAAPDPERGGRELIDRAAEAFGLTDWRTSGDGRRRAEVVTPLCFDITDLMEFFGHSRLPTGIQRVQIEVVAALVTDNTRGVTLCCYIPVRMGWAALPIDRFLALARLSLSGDDRLERPWQEAVLSAHFLLAAASLMRFVDDTTLINLGASWSDHNYLLHLRAAREEASIVYVPMVHDLIPVIAPDWPPVTLVRDFLIWLDGVFGMANGFLTNSLSTRSDLLQVAMAMGHDLLPAAVRAVRLDGNFRRAERLPPSEEALARLGLDERDYVLLVSTIEPRKNHVGAFLAWRELAQRLGPDAVPTLACAGRLGWRHGPVETMLAQDPWLREKVRLLPGLSDAELDLLYEHSIFTLYPSLYEGWGLPVTESLCHGKIPAISNVASLPEAGGDLAVYFDPHDPVAIAAAIAPLVTDRVLREEGERRIREYFRPRSWSEIARHIVADAHAMSVRVRERDRYPLEQGRFYSLALVPGEGALRGEQFRHGKAWGLPGIEGNPVNGTARLRLDLPDGGPWLLRVELAAATGGNCRVSIKELSGTDSVYTGELAAGARCSATLRIATEGTDCAVIIEALPSVVVTGFGIVSIPANGSSQSIDD